MIKDLKNKQERIKSKFNLAWILFTVVFLCFIQYHIVSFFQLRKEHNFQTSANLLAFKVDELIEELLESVNVIPFYKNDLSSCNKSLKEQLQSIVFTNPNVSGIVISDINNKILCASSHFISKLPRPVAASPVLLGPIKFGDDRTEVFLLQQRLGQYHIGLYLIKPYLLHFLERNGPTLDYEGLFDRTGHSMLLQNNNHFDTNLLSSLSEDEEDNTLNGSIYIKLPLHNLDNIDLIVSSDPIDSTQRLILAMLFFGLVYLGISWLFYRYFIRLISKRYSINQALQNALKGNQFRPSYQAVRDEASQCFCGAEVLLRWYTEFDEVIMPDHFISDAEKSGIIVPITLQLMETAFKECLSILHENPSFHLAFNLSPNHFHDPHFFKQFYELCAQFNIPAHQVILEITERELFSKNDVKIVNQMNELTQRGYALALDDFGTGQANIQYLQHFPFQYLKIDKLFVHSIGTGAVTESLNLSIINMANTLGLKVIAEGVETDIQLDYLKNHGVTLIQGWIYTKAIPYKEFAELIKKDSL